VLVDIDERNRTRESEQVLRSVYRKQRGDDRNGTLFARQFTGKPIRFTSTAAAYELSAQSLVLEGLAPGPPLKVKKTRNLGQSPT